MLRVEIPLLLSPLAHAASRLKTSSPSGCFFIKFTMWMSLLDKKLTHIVNFFMCFNLIPKGIIMTEQQQLDILNLIEEQLSKKRKKLSRKLIELEIEDDQRIMCNNIIENKELYENVDSIDIKDILYRRSVEDYHRIDNIKKILKEEINEVYMRIHRNNNLTKSVVENFKILKDLENNE